MTERFDNHGFKATASRLPIAILSTDSSGRVTWVNRAFKKLCGFSKKEMLGRKPGEFLQGPKTDPATIERIRKARENEDHVMVKILNYRKNGHPYWVNLSISPFFDADGRLEGSIGLAQEVTKREIHASELKKDLVGVYSALVSECSSPSSLAQSGDQAHSGDQPDTGDQPGSGIRSERCDPFLFSEDV